MQYMRLDQIVDLDGVLDTDRLRVIDAVIRALLITRQGTIPGSRDFGLSGVFIDAPQPTALNLLAVDLAEGISKYAPEVQLDRVEISSTEEVPDGAVGITVYVGGA